jgi:hypothetical protein
VATRTAINVRDAVLEHLNIKAQGDSAVAEDALKADDVYTSVYKQLLKKGLAQWAKNSVPEQVWEPLTLYLAGFVARKFGFTGQRRVDALDDTRQGLRLLQEQASGIDFGPTQVEFM